MIASTRLAIANWRTIVSSNTLSIKGSSHQVFRNFLRTVSTMSYPGVDRDLRWLPESQYLNGPHYYPIGAHCNCNRALSNMLPIREVFMMALMNALTDKLDWHKKVFDEQIVAKWRQEAREQPEDGLYMQILASQRGPFGSDVSAKPRERFLSERAFDYVSARSDA